MQLTCTPVLRPGRATRRPGTRERRGARVALPFRSDPRIKFDYQMAMGVRFGVQPWKDTLDAWIVSHRGEIGQIPRSYHIPLIDSRAPQG